MLSIMAAVCVPDARGREVSVCARVHKSRHSIIMLNHGHTLQRRGAIGQEGGGGVVGCS